jgi:hypothetical protein
MSLSAIVSHIRIWLDFIVKKGENGKRFAKAQREKNAGAVYLEG